MAILKWRQETHGRFPEVPVSARAGREGWQNWCGADCLLELLVPSLPCPDPLSACSLLSPTFLGSFGKWSQVPLHGNCTWMCNKTSWVSSPQDLPFIMGQRSFWYLFALNQKEWFLWNKQTRRDREQTCYFLYERIREGKADAGGKYSEPTVKEVLRATLVKAKGIIKCPTEDATRLLST